VIREKATYPANTPDGGAVSFSKYTVSLRSPKNAEPSLFESKDITRDRRSFSKNLIRSFLRDSLTKGAWHGAPWVVKDRLARELDLPLEVPLHLQQSTKLAEKRALARQRKAVSRAKLRQRQNLSMTTISDISGPDAQNSTAVLITAPPTMQKPWQSKPGGKQKHRFIQHDIQTFQPGAQQQFVQLNRVQSNYRTVQYTANGDGHMQAVLLNPGEDGSIRTSSPPLTTLTIQKKEPSPPFVAPVRYPIEDLENPPRDSDMERPPLKFFTETHISNNEKDQASKTGKLEEKSVGPLLEVWNTLNVHNEVFILDSFTLDDFAQALCFSSVDVYCELLSEMHCAVLKQLVNDKGQLMVNLPQFDDTSEESDDEEEESEQEEEPADEPEPDPDPEPLRRTTRGSLAKAEALALASQRDTTPEAPVVHSGEEFRQSFSWTDLCKEREFKNGGWQTILVGLLYQLSLSDPVKARCDKVLSHLIPLGTEPTVETITEQYATLDVNLRLDALAMVVLLAVQTRAIREHLEKMSLEMTELRKRRIEQQRLKKDL
jgi:DDT domain